MRCTLKQVTYIFLHCSKSLHALVARKHVCPHHESGVLGRLLIALAAVLHLGVEESVKLVGRWLMQAIDALLQPVGVVILRVKFAVKRAQDAMHAVGEPFWPSEDLTWGLLILNERELWLLQRLIDRLLRGQHRRFIVEYAAVVR